VKHKLPWFLAGSLGLWLMVSLPAWFWLGEQGLLETSLALLLCLVPMTATLLWCTWALASSPDNQLVAVMGGSGLRLLVVGAVGVLLHQRMPALQQDSFLLWVVFFYLATLTLEVIVMVKPTVVSPPRQVGNLPHGD
jgi:hypothetical protein